MTTDADDKLECPKCGHSDDIIIFNKDFYIVKDDDDFVKRKLYGCRKCESMFTFDNTKKSKSTKYSKAQSIFSKISKQCENVTNGISMKQ
jgi:hypothetical protein